MRVTLSTLSATPSTVARMRGWILLALGEVGVTDYELACVLEELDTGRGPYVVAAAATGK